MSIRDSIRIISEELKKDIIILPARLNYEHDIFEPVLTKKNVDAHMKLHRNYVEKANESDFFQAGAYLHQLWWENLCPTGSCQLRGVAKEFIENHFDSVDEFKEQVIQTALEFNGSGWVALLRNGEIVTIEKHKIVKNIVLLLDIWEHAYYMDWPASKDKYIKNIWRLINWDVVSTRLT